MSEKKNKAELLRERYPKLTDPTVAEFLLAETKYIVHDVETDLKNADSKAIAQVGFSGTVVAIVAGLHSSIAAWAQVFAGVLLLAAIALSVFSILVRGVRYPTLSYYMDSGIVEDPTLKACIAAELANSWQDYIKAVSRLVSSKATPLRFSAVLFAAAIGVLAAGAIIQTTYR